MSSKLKPASAIAVTATFLAAIASAQGSGAIAQIPYAIQFETQSESTPEFISEPVVQQLPVESGDEAAIDADASDSAGIPADSLADLVATQTHPAELSSEMRCLAGAIYFEAKSESLAGQLAVGRVVVNRAQSGRFPDSYCGVVYQPSQFSFVRGRKMPAINTASRHWRRAVAVAQIAHANSWDAPAEGALFFHATHVSPRWRLTRVARVENHIFYR